MLVLGITGGIGSGKTAVLHILKEEYQAYIIEADTLAHQLMEPGREAYHQIVEHFGDQVLLSDKTINRVILGQIVFSDPEKLALLNNIVHPAVKKEILHQIKEQQNAGCELFVIEAALLLQDGYKDICDEIWNVYADIEVRIDRLCKYRNFTRERALSVIRSQMDDTYYREGCNYTIDNSGNLDTVKTQIQQKLCT